MLRVVLLAGVLAGLAPKSTALACSAPWDGGCAPCERAITNPLDGELDVRLDRELDLDWYCSAGGEPPATWRVRLLDADEPIAMEPANGRMRPIEPLAPDTYYVIEDLRHGESCSPPNDDFVTLTTFRTGHEIDGTPPPVPAPCFATTACVYGSCGDTACCGPWGYVYRTVVWPGEPGALYELSVDGESMLLDWPAANFGRTSRDSNGRYPAGEMLPAGTIVVTAIDASGNRSAPSAPLVVPACAPPHDGGVEAELTACGLAAYSPDAGVEPPRFDAGRPGTGLDGGTSPASMGGGACSVRPGARGGATFVWVLLGSVVALTRRR